MTNETRRNIAFLGALCVFLSTVEYLIPKPLPFMRLGLANLPILLALSFMKPKEIIILVALKIAGQGFINGTLFSYIFLFSLGGTVASASVMMVLYYAAGRWMSFIGISLGGAMASSLVQLVIARWLIFGKGTRLMAPLLIISGCVSSVVLGAITERFKEKSEWLKIICREA